MLASDAKLRREGARWQIEGDPTEGALIVAASDADSFGPEQADFVCDGVDDDLEIQQAIDALPERGGTIILSDGRFNLSAGLVITENKRVMIHGQGALLALDAGVTGILDPWRDPGCCAASRVDRLR